MHMELLRSPLRVATPEEADLVYVPIYLNGIIRIREPRTGVEHEDLNKRVQVRFRAQAWGAMGARACPMPGGPTSELG